jgi:molybdopterin-containing oxidoreductase family iron-sulfur binding subunit
MPEITRRTFLKIAAGGGAAVADTFTKNAEKLIPYVSAPKETIPGEWTIYATTCRECPAGCGMHVRCQDGRVVKVEGNPDHPISRGGLCPRGQSAVQGLYDPDRVRGPLRRVGNDFVPTTWDEAIAEIGKQMAKQAGQNSMVSDFQNGALKPLLEQGYFLPSFLDPLWFQAVGEANKIVLGNRSIPDYRIDKCRFIISFGADFLEGWVSPVQDARRFADFRAIRDGQAGRFVYVSPRLSQTAANADEFLRADPVQTCLMAWAMLGIIIEKGWAKAHASPLKPLMEAWAARQDYQATACSKEKLVELARAFAQTEGSVALAGAAGATGDAAMLTCIAAALLNHVCGRTGDPLDFTHSQERYYLSLRGQECQWMLSALTSASTLIVHNCNPAYTLTGACEAIAKAGLVVYLGTMLDETAQLAHWVLPIDSPLESWGDSEPVAGIHCLQQPAMRRLWDTRPAGDILLALAKAAGKRVADGDDFESRLRGQWEKLGQRLAPDKPFDEFWEDALRAGGSWESPVQAGKEKLALRPRLAESFPRWLTFQPALAARPDTAQFWGYATSLFGDGQVANRGWIQEAPDPMTTIVWGSWIEMHPSKAKQLGLETGDVVALTPLGSTDSQSVLADTGPEENRLQTCSTKAPVPPETVEAPVRVTEDIAENTVAMAFGQGHTALGRNAKGRGANAFRLLGYAGPGDFFGQVTIRKTGRKEVLAALAPTQDQHEREILQWVELSQLRALKPGDGPHLTLPLPEGYDKARDVYPPHEYKRHRWAMVIDAARCTGCGACAVACYAENNLPVMGKEQAFKGREMAWLKVVPYRRGEEPGRVGFLPLLCQQCDAAPCEPVCPVFASVHNDEGLNAQVYNRCIGTRYCSHNCPYKVRRFNWLNHQWDKPLDVQLNPEVSARSRGVMEKCTFCIQRIREAEHRARRAGRQVYDGEIAPACAQSCPTRAFVFGDLLDKKSQVYRLTTQDPRRYHVLEELNTKPAVTYLKRIVVD